MKHLDQVPSGYTRLQRGWLVPNLTPHAVTIAKLRKQNEALKNRLDSIESLVKKFTNDNTNI